MDYGADDEARTRYLHLGKVALYQMSYIRNCKRHYIKDFCKCQEGFLNFFKIVRVDVGIDPYKIKCGITVRLATQE